jgi:3-oxoacyl-[acyl-carrier protein] reductase
MNTSTALDFSNKVVLITGGSRGVGREIARQFAENNARVAINYTRNEQAANETLAMLPGDGHMLAQADISDPQAVRSMVDDVHQRMNGLDILVNNAGIYEDHPLTDMTYSEWQAAWQRILHVNLLGAANCIYCAAQYMLRAGGGRVVNVSSRGAFRGEPTSPAYGASKAGMNSMGQSLAQALAPHNIFVNTVAPGFIDTEMATAILKGPQGEAIRKQSPLHRVATPQEVAYVVLFLASEQAAFTTGAIVDINGASYLRS